MTYIARCTNARYVSRVENVKTRDFIFIPSRRKFTHLSQKSITFICRTTRCEVNTQQIEVMGFGLHNLI